MSPHRVRAHGLNAPPPDLGGEDGASLLQIDLSALRAALRRQRRVMLGTLVLFVVLGVIYLVAALPKYTSTIGLLIDSRRNQDQLSVSIAELAYDTGAIDSQLEIIRSEKVALAVVTALSLDKIPEFANASTSFAGTVVGFVRKLVDIRRWFISDEVLAEEDSLRARRNAIARLQGNMSVKRVARTYVLQISYSSPNPAMAMQIAQAYADAYFKDQLDARYELTKRASAWLQDRISELKDSSLKTDLAVQRFKADKGIVSIGQLPGMGPTLVADQQLMELTTQLSLARNETSKAEARLAQIQDIIKAGKPDGAVTESLANPVINDLRMRYLKTLKTSKEFATRLGQRHYQVVSLRSELAQYEQLIFQELQRIAATTVSDVEIAKSRERNLNESMATLISQKAISNETMVSLRELERESDVFKTLYQAFLQRYQDTIQRETLPTSEARIISSASFPSGPSEPHAGRILFASTFLGLIFGLVLAFVRERRDQVFRTGAQVRNELGLEFLGTLPLVQARSATSSSEPAAQGQIRVSTPLLRHVLAEPFSGFAEVLRGTKVEIDLVTAEKKGPKIIGIVSVLPGEGKTTTSKNLATLISFMGAKTLLIDGDLRHPSLTQALAPNVTCGLVEVLKGKTTSAEAILIEPDSRLSFLPSIVGSHFIESSELLSSRDMTNLLQSLGEDYDYIIVDLPPLGPVVDVRAAKHLFDCFVFVVEWGKTPRSLVRDTLVGDLGLYEKCVGIVFNRADIRALDAYGKGTSAYAYTHGYGAVYGEMSRKG